MKIMLNPKTISAKPISLTALANNPRFIFSLVLTFTALLAMFGKIPQAGAAVPFPSEPIDLPPGAISGTNEPASSGLPYDPNIVAAVIGVAGLLAGSIITILATYFMRWMDVRREDRREQFQEAKSRRDKEYTMKHETYRLFLADLAELESTQPKNYENLKKGWARAEINLDLAASDNVRLAKDTFKKNLLSAIEKANKSGMLVFDDSYAKSRDELISAIRADIANLKNE